jgi:DNA phosphorothioation-dependent restriction protein DptH
MDLGTQLILSMLADELSREISAREIGYCLRVDHLDAESATFICSRLEQLIGVGRCYILSTKSKGDLGPEELNTERAIELRNRKPQAFILLVPSGVTDSTASSLRNAFAAFELDQYWRKAQFSLASQFEGEVRDFVSRAIQYGRLPGVSEEDRTKYCASVAASADMQVAATRECYRIGLIPDAQFDITRLESNSRAAREIARPIKSHSSLAERLDNVGVQNGPQRRQLEAYLEKYQLSDWRTWMREIAEQGLVDLHFNFWDLISRSQSQLRRLSITPWLDAHGKVERWSKLQQTETGTQPFATVGSSGEIQLRWESDPNSPEGLDKWRVEMIPSLDFYAASEVPDVSLPVKKVKGTLKRTSLKLSAIDWPEDTASIVVQVRLSALSDNGAELANDQDIAFEAISEEIQLRPELFSEGTDPEASSSTSRTSRDIPLAKLRLGAEKGVLDLSETSFYWSGTSENVFNLTVSSGDRIRVTLSSLLKELECKSLSNPRQLGIWECESVAGTEISLDRMKLNVSSVATGSGTEFLQSRERFFGQLKLQEARNWLSIAEWTQELSEVADDYVNAYVNWLTNATQEERGLALAIDTGILLLRCDGRTISASVTSPLHPLRAWFTQYQQTLACTTAAMAANTEPASERREKIDLTSFELLEPNGCPMLTIAVDGSVRLTAGCLDFLWTVALPVDWPDPARAFALVSNALGISAGSQEIGNSLVARCAMHVHNYMKLHEQSRRLRIVTDNAGDGDFTAKLLCDSVQRFNLEGAEQSDEQSSDGVESVELLSHFRQPLPSTLPGIGPLRQLLEQRGGKSSTSSFQPLLETAVRPSEELTVLPGGGAHITVLMDITTVAVRTELETKERGISAISGLLCPFNLLPGGPPWRYCIPAADSDDKLSQWLVTHQHALAACLDQCEFTLARLPVLTVAIEGDANRLTAIHQQSDWVITLDRFIEPAWIESDAGMKYLLDYSPDIADGLTRRLFVTTGHREEAEQIIGETLLELGFTSSGGAVTRVLNRLRQVSGRLALRTIGSGATRREAAALAIAIEKMNNDGLLRESILVPVDSHIEMFTPARKKGRPEQARRCDLLLIKRLGANSLEFTLVEVKGRTHRPSPDVFAAIRDQLNSTEKLIQSLWCALDRYDRSLQLYRLRQILEYHLRRAIGFGTIKNPAGWTQTFEQLSKGRVDIHVHQKGFVVCAAAMPEIIRRGEVEIEVIGEIKLDQEKQDVEVQEARGPSGAFVKRQPSVVTANDSAVSKQAISLALKNDVQADPQPVLDGKDTMDDAAVHDSADATRPNLNESENNGVNEIGSQAQLSTLESPSISDREISTPAGTSGNEKAPVVKPKRNQGKGLFARLNYASDAPSPGADGPTNVEEAAASSSTAETVESQFNRSEIEIVLGDGPNGPVSWRPAVSGSPHLFIIGIPGQGKSVTTTRLLCELTKQNVPALVLDFHGEFASTKGAFSRLANPAILNAADGLPFSILEPLQGKGPRAKESIWELAEICQYVCGLGDIQRDSIYRAFESAYLAVDPNETPLLSSVSGFIEEDEDEGNAKNVTARCRPLFDFGLFADEPTEGIYEQFAKGAVIDLHELKSETLQLAAGAFTLRKLYRAMFSWGTADRIRLAIVLDEAHRLAKDVTLPKIMKEGRKFGLAVVVASQDVRDFHEQVLSNAGTKIIFRVNYPDSRKVSGFVRASSGDVFSQQIERLSVGEAIIQTPDMDSAQHIRMRRVSD